MTTLTSRSASGLKLAAGTALILSVFSADIATPADNVSICFAYTLPILIGVYTGPRTAYGLALASTLASVVGSFIEPPHEGIAVTFVANRIIAVMAQWLVAILIEQHKRSRAVMQGHLAAERLKAETGRRFVRILTHEIATALTSIGGHSYRLSKLAPTITPQDIVVRSEKIRLAVTRLDSLVSRIQAASEVDQGQLVVAPEWIDTEAFIGTLRSDYEGVPDLRLELRGGGTALYGDADLLHQAVSNLIANAVKYSPKPATVTVTLAPSQPAGATTIAIADEGFGIPDDELAHVFGPYYRARNTTGIRGLGLGLHLVKRYVEAHGGEVRIESRLEAGTRVSLHLPLADGRSP